MKSLFAWRYYVALFIVCAAVGVLIGSVGQMTIDNLKCRSTGYDNEHFLAYCRSQQYADYEHGALFYGLEPSVIDNIRRAEVLFVGNSKVQAGFSSKAVRDYFNAINIPFFVLGFGYGDESTFTQALLKKWPMSPKVLVINADPFFSEKLSPPGRDAIDGKPAFLWRLLLKSLFQRVHRAVCLVASDVCPQSEPSIFRSARDGQWNWIGPYTDEKSVLIDGRPQLTISQEELATAQKLGENFLDQIGLDRRCVVLTGAPNSVLDSTGIATALAASLKTSSIFPAVDGLSTLDTVHLNLASAERWSGQFVRAMGPILQKCISASLPSHDGMAGIATAK
jgi:hypothetical protein